jgi:hypothetical protein
MSDLKVIEPQPIPMCRHLRSKGMYVHGTTEELNTGVPGSGDGYFWCLKTMHLFGPDNQAVNRQECRPDRTCYETM